ncbi:adenylyl-sulfate kinase [Methylobacterium sp. IF7SW-B2]|jgi:adenylyl-sulfate kinase|nr:adenylyl-sulfate kinase [Methylobacterium ajmalii]MBK3410410.1 adenylyl-sulfate kinase [Methylobacterium ajmalii]MBK3425058.1 adenylyl-sulfate kinase [Methylobacterium ajmalii]SFF52812.1 adenylyl-sulfate kinase [Methylobacterium sp. yr596]
MNTSSDGTPALSPGAPVVQRPALTVGKEARAGVKGQAPLIVWMTGLSGAGKSTVANRVEEKLWRQGRHTMLLDGDSLRFGLNKDLGFTDADRVENVRRTAEVAKLMLEAGLIVLCSLISPFRRERALARQLVGPDEFLEVFVDAPIEECQRRDPKGLYARALAGQIPNFTGISSPYEAPEAPDLHLQTDIHDVETLADRVLDELRHRGVIAGAA